MKLVTLGACTLTLSAALACSGAPEDYRNLDNQGNQPETADNTTPAQRKVPGAPLSATRADIDWESVALTTTQHRYSPVETNPSTVIVDVPVYRSRKRIASEVTHRATFSANSPEVEAARAHEEAIQ